MTDLLSDLETPSDAELISRVRGGDVAAYGDLFSRHVDSANRLARQLVRGPDSDDLVSEAFAKVLQVLQGGGGPDVAFRAYLLTAVRRLHIDRMRAAAKVQSSDDMASFDPGVPFTDTAVAQFESGAAARAFATLPERWQLVLWHLEVEGQKPAEIARLLGMSANSVSALAYRAREGLRQAFLTMHLNDITETDCRWVNEHLGAYVRKGLSKRDSTKVQQHLEDCRRCTAMYLELTEVNSNLRGIIAPVLLGAAAAGYLSSTGSAGGIGLAAFLGRARDVVSANAGAATAGAVAAGVAAVATAGIVLLPANSPERIVAADEPVVRTSPELSFPPSASPHGGPSDAPSAAAPGAERSGTPSPTPAAGAAQPAALLDEGVGTTSGPAALPGQPGVLAPPLPGVDQPGPAGPGPGTDPGTGPGSNPDPGPTGGPNPGTDPAPNPGPTDPIDDPEPGPPGPGTDPTTPSDPDGEGGGTDLLVSTLRVPTDRVNLSENSLTFPVQGDPALPSTLIVSMDSGSSGIGFGPDGNCEPAADDPTTAICDTAPGGGGSSLAPVTADGGNNAFQVRLPLVVPEAVKSASLTISVLLPAGYDQTGNVTLEPLTWTAPATDPDPEPEPAKADLSLSGLPGEVVPSGGSYTVQGTVHDVPLDVDASELMFTADEGVTDFLATVGACSPAGSTQTCTVTFTMKDADGALPTTVTLSVQPLPDYEGDDTVDNAVIVTLLGPQIDASIDSTKDINGESGSGTVTVTVSGLPAGVRGRLDVTYDSTVLEVNSWPADCSAASCELGNGTFTFGVEVTKLGNDAVSAPINFSLSVPNHHDTNVGNNATSEDVLRDPGSGNEATAASISELTARIEDADSID